MKPPAAAITAATLAVAAACVDATSPRPVIIPCQTLTGPAVAVSGVQSSAYRNTGLADNTKVDASTAEFASLADIAILVGGGAGICFRGGQVVGSMPPATSYDRAHLTYGMVVRARLFQVEKLRVFDYGDGASMDAPGDADWSVRDVYFTYMRDDCVENDYLNSGTIENSLFDGCYAGLSARPYVATADGSHNVVVVRNSLFRLQDMEGFLRSGHGGFFKWDATAPMISLFNNVYRVDSPNIENDVLVPPPNKLKDCANNVMIWLGSGPFPEPLPRCYTLLTGASGLDYWNNAVAQWKARHAFAAVDIGPPIVSLSAPADTTTLAGTVDLTATAADDQDVAGVQFRLNGQDIGAEVTTASPLTKFTLSWDSHSLANGSYTLTATARDGAGHTTTSDGVPVTVSN